MSAAGSQLLRWRDLFVFAGPLTRVGRHCHRAPALVFSLDGPFELRLPDGRSWSTLGAQLPAGLPHELDCRGQPMVVAYRDPLHAAPVAAPQLPERGADWLIAARRDLAPLAANAPAAAVEHFAITLAAEVLPRSTLARSRLPDARLLALRERLEAESEWSLPLAAAARRAGLSPSRLSHLFTAETGLSWTAYRNWMRLMAAAHAMAERRGALTGLALDQGYASAAHFAAAFRAGFGIRPSELLRARPALYRAPDPVAAF